MEVPYPVVVMDMQHLQPAPQPCQEIFKINPHQIRMACVKAKAKDLRMIFLVKTVDTFRGFFRIAAWAFYHMAAGHVINIFHADRDPHLFCHRGQKIQKPFRLFPLRRF